jgi:hypothetical protein
VSDVTIEKLAAMLSDNPLGLLLYRDELDSFFGGLERYSSASDEPYYIMVHNGKPLSIDRKTSADVYVPNPSLSIIGGVQPAILQQRLKENPNFLTSGFFARWLLAMPPFEPVRDNDNAISPDVLEAWELLIDRLMSNREQSLKLDDNCENNLEPFVFPLSVDARKIYRKYQHEHADRQEYTNAIDGAFQAKFATNALRVALTLHCVGVVANDTAGFAALKAVSAETMQSACTIAEWFTNEAIRVLQSFSNGIGDNRFTLEEQEVLQVLQRQDKPMTIREMKHNSRPLKRIDDLEPILLKLKNAGRVTEQHNQSGTQIKVTYSLAKV